MNEAIEEARIRSLMRDDERLDDLNCKGWRILQRPKGFRFGMDAVLLAAFSSERMASRAVDLGTGSGVLPLLVSARVPGIRFDAVEIQPEIAGMAARTMQICHMEESIAVHAMDLRDAPEQLGYEQYDLVICNPPYGKAGANLVSAEAERRTARHEGDATISEICGVAFALLRNGGRFAAIFPAQRFLELVDAMRNARLEPKRVQMIHPACSKPPNVMLVEGMKGVNPGLHFMPPLFVRDEKGNETEALRSMYRA